MKNPVEVLKQKQIEAEKLHKEIVCLQIVIPLLREEKDSEQESLDR